MQKYEETVIVSKKTNDKIKINNILSGLIKVGDVVNVTEFDETINDVTIEGCVTKIEHVIIKPKNNSSWNHCCFIYVY